MQLIAAAGGQALTDAGKADRNQDIRDGIDYDQVRN